MPTPTFASMEPFLSFGAIALAKATILLALVALTTAVLRRRSATLRHLLWSLAVVGIATLPLLAALTPYRLHLLSAPVAARDVSEDRGTTSPSPSIGRDDEPMSVAATAPIGDGDISAAPAFSGTRAIAIVWLVVALLLMARFIAGSLAVRRIVSRAAPLTDEHWRALSARAARTLGLRAGVDVRVSDEVAMPFATGVFKATVVLPALSEHWTPERREAVLMHEFAHIRRGDLPMNALSHLARALYWFHPLAWYASYRLRVEGERACDDAVLRSGARPSDYAEHLLTIVRSAGNAVPAVALAMARRSDFEGRLLAILEPDVPRQSLTRWRAAAVTAAFLFIILPLAAASPTAKASAMPAVSTVPPSSERSGGAEVSHASEPAEPQEGVTVPERQTPASSPAVAALVETLADANVAVRLAAVNSLGALEDPRAIAALAKALREDADPRVRQAAAEALGEIDDARAVPHLLDALKVERVARVRESIVRSLGEIDDSSAVAGIAAVVKDASVGVRRAAVAALGELEDPAAVPALTGMARDEDVEVRKHVAEALGNLESIAALDPLTILARDTDAEVRAHAIDALGNLEDPRTMNTLVTALKDASAEVRSQAADAIHNLPDLKTAPRALIDALADADSEVRHNVAHALGSIGDEAAVPGLKKLTADTDVDVRRAAAEALSEIGGAEAITALMGLLKDQDPEIRRVAAEALGKRR